MTEPAALSYILPIRNDAAGHDDPQTQELAAYLRQVAGWVRDVIVVDGSSPEAFAAHRAALPDSVRHVAPDQRTAMGKVDGVMTGLRLAREDRVVIADDDVRYAEAELQRMASLLGEFSLVRPQNYFEPAPWHALWDTSRTLLNRLLDGDWPGTLGVRRQLVLDAGGYPIDVMFENLEMVRLVQAAGGSVVTPLDLYVRRHPPALSQFLDQRIRQAYDEFARPARLLTQLALLPALLLLVARRRRAPLLLAGSGLVAAAEMGRRRDGGVRYFPAAASWFAPLWVLERGVTSWLALASQLRYGGVRYRGRVVPRAAHSERWLRARIAERQTPAT